MDDQRSVGEAPQDDRVPRARDAGEALETPERPETPNAHEGLNPLDSSLIQAHAVAHLRAGGDPVAADLLASCRLLIEEDALRDLTLVLVGQLARQPGPLDLDQPMVATLAQALRAALPAGVWLERLWARPTDAFPFGVPPAALLPTHANADGLRSTARAPTSDTSPTAPLASDPMRDEPGGLNQAVGELAPRMWAGMRFRSESELHIAQALERAGALFFPGALARIGAPGARHTREADFLICWQGRWGILEVDGAPFHGPDRSRADAERDQVFHTHGVGVIVRVDALRCFASPDAVVSAFLAQLDGQGGPV